MIIDRNNVIVAGHTRYKAAKKLGLTEVPCVVADDLDDEKIKALRLVDNQVAEIAEWDFELLEEELAGIIDLDMSEYGFDLKLENENADDIEEVEAPAIPEEPEARLGDIYQLGKHRLMCGDSTKYGDVAKLMDGATVDLLLTDPPYNVDITGRTKEALKIDNDNMDRDVFREFLRSAFSNAIEYLKEGGAYYVFHASRTQIQFEEVLTELELQVREQLIWVKNTFVLGRQDYQWQHEPIFYGWKEGEAHYFINQRNIPTIIEDRPDLDKMKKEDMRKLLEELYSEKVPTTAIKENRPAASREHPTMKPIKLLARLIINSSRKNEKVLDLFRRKRKHTNRLRTARKNVLHDGIRSTLRRRNNKTLGGIHRKESKKNKLKGEPND